MYACPLQDEPDDAANTRAAAPFSLSHAQPASASAKIPNTHTQRAAMDVQLLFAGAASQSQLVCAFEEVFFDWKTAQLICAQIRYNRL
jgi:hypothetical protein